VSLQKAGATFDFTPMHHFIAFLFGLLFGSYGNSVVHRLPRQLEEEYLRDAHEALGIAPPAKNEMLKSTRSACPHCKTQIAWYDNLPLISWLVLQAKCRHCKAPISPRYFLLEAAGGILGVAAYAAFGATPAALVAFAVMLVLVWLMAIDIEHMILPDSLVFAVLWAGLLSSSMGYFTTPTKAILGAALGYGIPGGVAMGYAKLKGIDGMGAGDFKLLAAIGAFTGPMGVVLVLLASALLQVAVQGTLILAGKLQSDSPFPFGPVLAVCGGAAILLSHPFQLWLATIGQ
jgi:leader peptidase (prepilin peptidase)/N-methyltransferase